MQLKDLIDTFLFGYEGRDPAIAGRLTYWKENLGHIDVLELTAEAVDSALVALMDRGAMRRRPCGEVRPTGRPLSGASVNRYRAALASVLNWGKSKRKLPRSWQNPITAIPTEAESKGRLEYWSQEEVERMVIAARTGAWRKLPALIVLAFTTGLRKGALMGIRWADVDLERNRIVVGRTKNGDPIESIVTLQARAELLAIRPRTPDTFALVFAGKSADIPHDFRHAFEVAISDAGVERHTFHALRHSCASHLAKNDVALPKIAKVMGHRSINTTMRYAHLSTEECEKVVTRCFA